MALSSTDVNDTVLTLGTKFENTDFQQIALAV